MSRPFAFGDKVLFLDRKQRRYLVTLADGGEFHSHAGFVPHASLVDQHEGITVTSTMGAPYMVLRPTLSDFVVEMPRGAQVIYPKDIGPILLLADIGPGTTVFESGLGSGALSMAMLRAGAVITGYDIRDEFEAKARKNVASFLGPEALSRYNTSVRDTYEGIDAKGLDRVVLDLPEPWQVVPLAAGGVLAPGGILVAYTPQITQAIATKHAMDRNGFAMCQTIEVLQRGWHIEGQAARPDHRMVAHTGFLTSGRFLG
ncbi:MAG: tRNA (adenine-N1)-methyltransferase [Acidimicrobiia bacterium]